MRLGSRVRSFSAFWVSAATLGLAGVVISELFSELTRLFVDGSQVELLDAHFVEFSMRLATGALFGT